MSTVHNIDFRYAPASRWTCIGRPDDPYKTLVDENGSLLYEFQRGFTHFGTFRFNRVFSFAIQTDRLPVAIAQRTECARILVVVTHIRYPKATLTLRAFGHQHNGNRSDVVLWQISLQPGADEFVTALWLQAQAPTHRFVPPTLGPSHRIYALNENQVPTGQGLADLFRHRTDAGEQPEIGPLALISQPHPRVVASAFDHGPASGLRSEWMAVTADGSLEGMLLFPQDHAEVDGLDDAWAKTALEVERQFWQGYDLQPLAMEIPDAAVMDMVTACARNILQARQIKDGIPEFQVGPTVYCGLWVIDGHFLLEAAQYLRHGQAANQGIDALLRRVQPSGAIQEMDHHSKETAIALTTLVRQCELAGHLERLDELWPVVQKAVGYIQSLWESSGERGADAPEYGLMPPSFGDCGLGGLRPGYTTALWTLVGLQEVARVARQCGHMQDAQRFQAAFDDLLSVFQGHAVRDMGALPDGTPYLPMLMPGSGEHARIPDYPGTPPPWDRANPGTATRALTQAIYPGQVFAPDDPIVYNFCHLLDLLDDEDGIPKDTGWLPHGALWNYAASFYAHVWLYTGRPDKAIDYLYAFANHAAPTRVWREEQSLRDSHEAGNVGDMPHNWASARGGSDSM